MKFPTTYKLDLVINYFALLSAMIVYFSASQVGQVILTTDSINIS
jgi:hypothetical protein